MEIKQEVPSPDHVVQLPEKMMPDYRPELAFPVFTEDMVARIRDYSTEELVPANTTLYTFGDCDIDMYVVLEGEVQGFLPANRGASEFIPRLGRCGFTGEFNLLTSQRSLVEARTMTDSRLLRIPRKELRRLMRAEGDVANLIVQATIWRRIGIIRDSTGGVTLTGRTGDAETSRLQRFFVRNNYPLKMAKPSPEDAGELPAVTLSDGRVFRRPTVTQLADELGITELPDSETTYDVAVVGAGPSGLAAAVYAASEGLDTIVIEGTAPGGQAGTSSKIENYLGFPTGISGQQLASRAQLQALKFGVHFAISRETITSEQCEGIHKLTLAGGIPVYARSVVVASGAQYRRLSVSNHDKFENRGLYYAATAMESLSCRDEEIIVVGGGNSAGQAAIFLSGAARHVHHIVRGPSLAATMSQYLISRIEGSTHITLHTNTEIVKLSGETSLKEVSWINRDTGETTTRPISSVFVMIGAEPNSGWLYGSVKLDKKGFILTGGTDGFETTPYATSVPGMFAVGDVRASSVKRIASAVGEGSVVISDVHHYLADNRNNLIAQPNSALAALRAANAETRIAPPNAPAAANAI